MTLSGYIFDEVHLKASEDYSKYYDFRWKLFAYKSNSITDDLSKSA